MSSNRERTFVTELSIDECKRRLRERAEETKWFPERRGHNYAVHIRGSRFSLRTVSLVTGGFEFRGRLHSDERSGKTLIDGGFTLTGLGRVALLCMPLIAVACAYDLYQRFSEQRWAEALFDFGFLLILCFKGIRVLKPSDKAALKHGLKEILDVHCAT